MKNVIRCICMMAIVALAFTSCKKEEQKTTKPTTGIFTITAQDLVDGNVDENRAYFTPGNLKIEFEQGDMVMIFNIDEEVPTNSQCAQYAAVQEGNYVTLQNCGLGEVAENVRNAYYAYYPGGPDHIQCEFYQGENKVAESKNENLGKYINRFQLGAKFVVSYDKLSLFVESTLTPFFRSHTGSSNARPALDQKIYPYSFGFKITL